MEIDEVKERLKAAYESASKFGISFLRIDSNGNVETLSQRDILKELEADDETARD